jgi:predicted nucleic acid-binding protein
VARYVVDANVVVKWAVHEDLWQQADTLRHGSNELLAPNLLLVEALNALTQKLRRGEVVEDIVRSAYVMLLDELVLYPTPPLISAALKVSIDLGINMYDATYVALAIEQGCQLVTEDGGLTNSTTRLLREVVLPLGDIPLA